MKKKFSFVFVLILTSILAFAQLSVDASSSFRDVSHNHWANSSIQFMNKEGHIKGYQDGTFRPSKEISRAEFTAVLYRILKLEPAPTPFKDTQAATWANTVIGGAVKAGIIDQKEYGQNYSPNTPITRLEMAKMIARAYAINPEYKALLTTYKGLYNGDLPFVDFRDMRQADVPYIAVAFGTGMLTGYTDVSFGLNRRTNRAEAAVMLNRFINNRSKKPQDFLHLMEMKEIAETGTNATTMSNLNPRFKTTKELVYNDPNYSFETHRIYVIPLHNSITSMYEQKYVWDRKEIFKRRPLFADPKIVSGIIVSEGEMTFKRNNLSYFEVFGGRLFMAGGNGFFYHVPLQKFKLNYLLAGEVSNNPTVKEGDKQRITLYGYWEPNEFVHSTNRTLFTLKN